MSKHKKIAVIGAGFGGLAAAALLAKDGYQVHVYEKNEQAGGRASQHKAAGFTFDMGPSWYMMPEVFDRYYAHFGKKPSDFFQLLKLDPQYRVLFEDGEVFDVIGDHQQMAAKFEQLEAGAGKKFAEYLKESKLKYEISMRSVLYKNMDSPLDMVSQDLIKHGASLQVFQTMHKHISQYFSHPKIQQILEYNLVFLGCSPKNAPALFSMMTHVDTNLGVYYPQGGMYELVKSLVTLGKQQGVTYHYHSPVSQIQVADGKATGVEVNGKLIPVDAVVSNADYPFTENLLSDQTARVYSREYWQKKVWSPSAFLLYLGVKKKLPAMLHHTLYFGDDWSKHFRDIFDQPRWPVEPSIYINKASATDPSVAPKGQEALMVLVPIAPGLDESDHWRESYANFIIDFLEDKMKVELKKSIVYKKIFSVSDFAERYNSYSGNGLGGIAHTLWQSAVWRPSNRSTKVNNLFYVGAGTVPGIGVPPAYISAELVRERVKKGMGS